MKAVRPPRAVFVDHPVGRTFGPPHDRGRNREILTGALLELSGFSAPGEIHDLNCRWEPAGSRAWEAEIRAEILRDKA
ncbi:MAG TPA: hypothetical protein VIB79_03835 [Candidatus Binatia bacterium]